MDDIHITPEELFARIGETLDAPPYMAAAMMHETLALTCEAGLRGTAHNFGNMASKVDALCRKHNMVNDDAIAVKRARVHSNMRGPLSQEDIAYDCRALSLMVSAVFGVPVPHGITVRIPHNEFRHTARGRAWSGYIRCMVREWDDRRMTVEADTDDGTVSMAVGYADNNGNECHGYLKDIIRQGTQLNLLGCREADGLITADMIVVEPDYLTDISTIANCFEDYGHHPLQYVLNMMKPRPNTRHTLLGNFAGRALDDIVNDSDCPTEDIIKTNFRQKALEYATCTDFDAAAFKRMALQQTDNIRQCAGEMFIGHDRSEAILEPSFVCEQLGISGRVDLMTLDKSLLVEQKAGKNIFIERGFRNRHGSLHLEKHYVQVLLYYGILHYNFGLPDGHVRLRLLYSRYPLPSGLLEVEALKKLLREAIEYRNRVVAQQYDIAQHGFGTVMDSLSPDILNTEGDDSLFYKRYLQPQIEETTAPLHMLDDTERAYMCRMMTFVAKEQLLSKVGTGNGLGNSAADLWNMPLQEKMETGNIYTAMTIVRIDKSDPHGGYDTVVMNVPKQNEDFIPNFRRGDMVYLYSYKEGELPDARRSILFKGVMANIWQDRLEVRLNDGQRNTKVFGTKTPAPERTLFAIEHAYSDSAGTAAVRSLHELATAPADRRALLLSRREPRRNAAARLSRRYNSYYDDILLKAKQAEDFFLIIGPPGTGKTSMAMRFIVEEQLAERDGGAILIMSYTNRAVDEICSMLQSADIAFLRIGGEYSCEPQFRNNMIGRMAEECPKLSTLKDGLKDARVVVATTSTLLARPFIFNIKRFALAIVDEAGQITEPNIVGLLAAHTRTGCKEQLIDKFILIGDYKQLPAVVQQDETESTVTEPLLNAIGLRNCRDSLMERLARREQQAGRNDFLGILRRQGRMHPDVAEFPNNMFYRNERIIPVPCKHQSETMIGYVLQPDDHIDSMLARHRTLFVPSEPCRDNGPSEKVNTDEAYIVALLLVRIRRLLGTAFDPQKSVGVIVPYRNQIAMIRREMAALHFEKPEQVSIDTVERYQGSQKDIIIYSFTIHRRYQLEFLAANRFDENGLTVDRKLNVALTRARKQMIVTGNPQLIGKDRIFRQLIEHIELKGGILKIERKDTATR